MYMFILFWYWHYTNLDPLDLSTSGPAVEGQKVHMICQAKYYGALMPVMQFLDHEDQIIKTDVINSSVGSQKLARYMVSAIPCMIQPHVCN